MAEHAKRQINADLTDELEAINAIYGDATIIVTSCQRPDIVCLLKLGRKAFSFEICFPTLYPDEPPEVIGIDPLWMGQWQGAKRLRSVLDRSLQANFTAGQVCMFDCIEAFILDQGLDVETEKEKFQRPLLQVADTKTSKNKLIDIKSLQTQSFCAGCLDEYLDVDLIRLNCLHSYCTDCLQGKSTTYHSKIGLTEQVAFKPVWIRRLHSPAVERACQCHFFENTASSRLRPWNDTLTICSSWTPKHHSIAPIANALDSSLHRRRLLKVWTVFDASIVECSPAFIAISVPIPGPVERTK